MKCIQCQTDNTLKDRTDNSGRCKQCQHPFVFEPTAMRIVKVTDVMFAKALADLSVNDTLYFTPKQLFYLLNKRLQGKTLYSGLASLILCGFLTFFTSIVFVLPNLAEGNPFPLVIPVAINLVFLLILLYQSADRAAPSKSRQIAARCLQVQGIAILGVGILLSLSLKLFPVFVAAVVIGILAIYLGAWQHKVQANTAQTVLLEANQFQEWLTRWQDINPIAKLLPIPKENTLPAAINPDVTAYSFDRLVVTDSAAIAQLLIANNFHFENNCAILSITGYPQSIFQTTMEMLRRNPDLKVYAFHDCSAKGMSLVNHLRTNSSWFSDGSVEIFDVGLMPRQILSLPNSLIQQSTDYAGAAKRLPESIRRQLSKDELAWLDEGNVVLLESFTTQRLIQALNRGIAASRGLIEGSSDGGSDLIFVGDSGSPYYSVESFG
ncbi:MAG: hypothetical protein NW224_22280 [Leptolyngbyaceae cyanobacterium bins.302]|nr:hypothetical protein [Leptolyngbyaceae cyanobacterium bins.302]